MNYLEIWQRYKNLKYDDLPEDVVRLARQCLLDWFGCATAGSREPLALILREEFGHRAGDCTVIGSDIRVDAATAALLNGASGHALDYDDTGASIGCHTTAPVIPAVMAIAEENDIGTKALLTAFVVGVEIEGRINLSMGTDHYAKGWHTTATYGTFGATAAAAHLLQLDESLYGIAMGLAASHAGGVKANFGTMTKPFHAGHAAESGVNSARLAARGFTANPAAVLGSQGFIQAASTPTEADDRLAAAAEDWMIRGTLFKYHAACHLTHATIESVNRLRETLDPAELSSLTVTVHPGLLDVCGIESPVTGLEGKFSLRGTASLALNGIDTANPATYVDEVISSDAVQAMINRVKVETDSSLKNMQTRVTWVDNRQQAHEHFHDVGVPEPDLDVQQTKLERKFSSLCHFASVNESEAIQVLTKIAG